MSIKNKIVNVMAAHPKFVTFVIGLGITMAVGTAIGMFDHNLAYATQVVRGGNGGIGGAGGAG
jgi:hypothetical protein